ncbi:hypothetical protein D3C75_768840 [compost metagenome]
MTLDLDVVVVVAGLLSPVFAQTTIFVGDSGVGDALPVVRTGDSFQVVNQPVVLWVFFGVVDNPQRNTDINTVTFFDRQHSYRQEAYIVQCSNLLGRNNIQTSGIVEATLECNNSFLLRYLEESFIPQINQFLPSTVQAEVYDFVIVESRAAFRAQEVLCRTWGEVGILTGGAFWIQRTVARFVEVSTGTSIEKH